MPYPQGRPKPKPVPQKKIKAELRGKRCNHDHKHIETNSKGRQFWQCSDCPAFLGWV